MNLKRWPVWFVAAVAIAFGVPVTHDLVQNARFDPNALCVRPDDSYWRDWYTECAPFNDPRCHGHLEPERRCGVSTPLTEGWRHSCTWFFFRRTAPPTDGVQGWIGSPPGAGCAGRGE